VNVDEIASDAVIDAAYAWLCERREEYSANDDVWNVRWRWAEIKPRLQAELLAGTYRFSAVRLIQTDEDIREVWSALDALVLKAMAIVLTRRLKSHLSRHCYHLHGGGKAAVRAVADHLGDNRFVLRTDVRSYYASIDHDVLFELLRPLIQDERVMGLLWQYLHRVMYDDGLYRDVKQGISFGCSLSPLMGALYLHQLDERVVEMGLFYARFMDDWVTRSVAPSRWKLRKAIKVVNQTLAELKVEKHPDKTFIGRIERGFDFLGYRFSSAGLGIAPQTIDRFKARAVPPEVCIWPGFMSKVRTRSASGNTLAIGGAGSRPE
jgi:hypothetical protein